MASRGKVIRFPRTPPGGPGGGPTGESGFVPVHRCRDQAEAMVVRSLLESEGIPSLLRSRVVHSVHPFSIGDQGEVTILVPEADEPRSRRLLARVSPGSSFA
jgi:hypothetical protein